MNLGGEHNSNHKTMDNNYPKSMEGEKPKKFGGQWQFGGRDQNGLSFLFYRFSLMSGHIYSVAKTTKRH